MILLLLRVVSVQSKLIYANLLISFLRKKSVKREINNSGLIKIVEYVQAVKEMSMEKALRELDVTWSSMEFEHEKHTRTQLSMLKASEELLETLRDNQVCLTVEMLQGFSYRGAIMAQICP